MTAYRQPTTQEQRRRQFAALFVRPNAVFEPGAPAYAQLPEYLMLVSSGTDPAITHGAYRTGSAAAFWEPFVTDYPSATGSLVTGSGTTFEILELLDIEQVKKNAEAIALLDRWLKEATHGFDAKEAEELRDIQQSLDAHRSSRRKLFP